MRVVIKEKEYEYQSDYNKGWRYSSGDDFKFPVTIGRYECFIKRFERKRPGDISGWGLLEKLKAGYEAGVPRVHDIVAVTENKKGVNYVFYECLEGDTMDNRLKDGEMPDPATLAEDVFRGLGSIHRHGYWFADFCEKNIFWRKGGHFFLVDLDSAQPVSTPPENGMYANMEYWASAFDYLVKNADCRNFKPSDISGVLLDYIMVMLMVLRVRLCSKDEKEEYFSPDIYQRLPGYLDTAAPELKKIFRTLLEREDQVPTAAEVAQLKEILLTRIIEGKEVKTPEVKKDRVGDRRGAKQLDRHSGSLPAVVTFPWKKVLVPILVLLALLAFAVVWRNNRMRAGKPDTQAVTVIAQPIPVPLPVKDTPVLTTPPPVIINKDSIARAHRADSARKAREQKVQNGKALFDSIHRANVAKAMQEEQDRIAKAAEAARAHEELSVREKDQLEKKLLDSLAFANEEYHTNFLGLSKHRRLIMHNKSSWLLEKVVVEIVNPSMGKNEIMTLSQVRPHSKVILVDNLPKDSRAAAVARSAHLPVKD